MRMKMKNAASASQKCNLARRRHSCSTKDPLYIAATVKNVYLNLFFE